MHALEIINETQRFVQTKAPNYFFPQWVAEAVGCSYAEAFLALIVLEQWKKVGRRRDGRWFLVVS